MSTGLPAANMTRDEVLRMLRCPTCFRALEMNSSEDGALCLWCPNGAMYSAGSLGLTESYNDTVKFSVLFNERKRKL